MGSTRFDSVRHLRAPLLDRLTVGERRRRLGSRASSRAPARRRSSKPSPNGLPSVTGHHAHLALVERRTPPCAPPRSATARPGRSSSAAPRACSASSGASRNDTRAAISGSTVSSRSRNRTFTVAVALARLSCGRDLDDLAAPALVGVGVEHDLARARPCSRGAGAPRARRSRRRSTRSRRSWPSDVPGDTTSPGQQRLVDDGAVDGRADRRVGEVRRRARSPPPARPSRRRRSACTCSSSDLARAVEIVGRGLRRPRPVSARRFSRSRCSTTSASCARAVAARARAAATRACALATATRWSLASSSKRTCPALTVVPSRTFALSTRPTSFDETSTSTWGTTYPVDVSCTCACAGDTSATSVSATSVLKNCASSAGRPRATPRRPTRPP